MWSRIIEQAGGEVSEVKVMGGGRVPVSAVPVLPRWTGQVSQQNCQWGRDRRQLPMLSSD